MKTDLSMSIEHYRKIVEDTHEGIWLLDARARTRYVNGRMAEMLGYTVGEMLGATFHDFTADDQRLTGIDGYARTHVHEQRERVFRRKDGTPLHALVSVNLVDEADVGGSDTLVLVIDISARVQLEDALRQGEARFRDFAETAADWFWEMDADLRFTWFSERIGEALGVDSRLFIGKTRLEFMDPADANAHWDAHFEDMCQRREFRDFEYHIMLPGDRIQYIRISGRPVFDRSGTFVGYRGVGRNISVEVEARHRAVTLQARLQDAVESISEGLVLFDADDRLVLCNSAYRDAVAPIAHYLQPGLSFERLNRLLLGAGLIDIPPEQHQSWLAYRTALHRDRSKQVVLPVTGGRWIEVNEYLTQDCGTLILRADITERVRAEERLRQAATVFEHTREGVVITDAQCNIIAVNAAFSEITGYGEAEVIGRNPGMLKSGRHGKQFYQQMWASINQSGYWRGEIWNRRKNGEIYPEWQTVSVVRDDTGTITNYVAVLSDISSIRESEATLEHLAHHDSLTGLPNRLLFTARVEHALKRAQRDGQSVALLFVDLDHFKNINDSLGHPVGDLLLMQAAERLLGVVRDGDTVARLGGDEFTLLLEGLRDERGATHIAAKIVEAFNDPFIVDGHVLHVGVSIGISVSPADGEDFPILLRNADAAMYHAKARGRNGYQFYTAELTASAQERMSLENSLRQALRLDQFEVYYQPQLDLASGQVIGAEALLRWNHPEMGLVGPDRFIPVAEDTGLIIPIGAWILQSACRQLRQWQRDGLPLKRVSVNLSGQQLRRGDLVATVRQALAESGLAAQSLELEITEGFIMQQAEKAIEVLDQLRALGVTLSIDDFGTGYSSLAYLKRLPIDTLKIDKSFVRDIPHDVNDEAIARAVIALATSLQLGVIAEGIETAEQRTFLLNQGCRQGQGYLFSPPVPAARFVSYLEQVVA
ncbi:MAG: EAL domain-containing protein [Rhodocyclales bacterium]|nr:EAL domain-containing protein [Rhodocyclales bacterium]